MKPKTKIYLLAAALIYIAAVCGGCGASKVNKTSSTKKIDSAGTRRINQVTVQKKAIDYKSNQQTTTSNNIEVKLRQKMNDNQPETVPVLLDNNSDKGKTIAKELTETLPGFDKKADSKKTMPANTYKVKVNGNEIESDQEIESIKVNGKTINDFEQTIVSNKIDSTNLADTSSSNIHKAEHNSTKDKWYQGTPMYIAIGIVIAGLIAIYFIAAWCKRKKNQISKIEKIFPNV